MPEGAPKQQHPHTQLHKAHALCAQALVARGLSLPADGCCWVKTCHGACAAKSIQIHSKLTKPDINIKELND